MIIGAYAAATGQPGEPDHTAFLRGLARDRRVTGLEIPSHHLLRADIEDSLFAHLPVHWSSAVTCFPGTMSSLLDDPRTGLASSDQQGRRVAIAQVARLRAVVIALNRTGPDSPRRISDVFLHSAPRNGTADALEASLAEISSWDWEGCRLDLEHCDAAVGDHPAEKGFLGLEAELAAITRAGGSVGVAINWARSAIETRSPQGPLHHLGRAADGRALRWLMFSGVADRDSSFGPAWADAHLPVDTVESTSLLTGSAIRDAIHRAGPDVELGLKVGLRPVSLDPAGRVAQVSACLDLVDLARSAGSAPEL